MKPSDIPANLAARVNFVLCREYRSPAAYHALACQRELYVCAFIESLTHPSHTVAEYLRILEANTHRPVLVMTFSEALVNVTGHLIMEGCLQPDDVKVFIIEGDEVTVSTFDADGVLVNWLFGWFQWETDLVDQWVRKRSMQIAAEIERLETKLFPKETDTKS